MEVHKLFLEKSCDNCTILQENVGSKNPVHDRLHIVSTSLRLWQDIGEKKWWWISSVKKKKKNMKLGLLRGKIIAISKIPTNVTRNSIFSGKMRQLIYQWGTRAPKSIMICRQISELFGKTNPNIGVQIMHFVKSKIDVRVQRLFKRNLINCRSSVFWSCTNRWSTITHNLFVRCSCYFYLSFGWLW